ncbi:hypothetical protein FSZ31_04615 [Sphingorhabdus soli]|uniref:Spermidine synthase n=1 Tax=Flavisphingopyxis soli TaxID=2601267 RepID=A0A5C6USX9_9SPHN|nr:hypothetical protein [Sphingorhabdus soli]TXC74008.1 hypothetical protein FSZ31_04615 [Sphingorhabdus soli]
MTSDLDPNITNPFADLRQGDDLGVALAGIDISALPVTPPDPLRDYYVPLDAGAWSLRHVPFMAMPGYWSGLQAMYGLVLLQRRTRTWMSLTPFEFESQQIGIDFARGHVAVFGLGMGWSAAMSALRPEVERVTVVELDDEVVEMHQRLRLFERLPGNVGEKVHIVHGDALEWKPDRPVDLLMPDVWLDLVSWERAEEVHDMQANVRADMVYFWGQELELARHAVRQGRSLDDAGLAQTAADFDLPLIGLDTPDYAQRTRAATRQWMLGRWLEGSDVPEDLRSKADAAPTLTQSS